jgi:hypothetical protein
MRHYVLETTPDTTHDLLWVTRRAFGDDWPIPPAEGTIWEPNPGEFHLSAVAEDGTWVKLCGPNVHKLHGQPIRVTVEDSDETVQVRERAPELILKYVARWKQSRARDEDDFMSGARMGWCQLIADLLDRPYNEVRTALEKGQM